MRLTRQSYSWPSALSSKSCCDVPPATPQRSQAQNCNSGTQTGWTASQTKVLCEPRTFVWRQVLLLFLTCSSVSRNEAFSEDLVQLLCKTGVTCCFPVSHSNNNTICWSLYFVYKPQGIKTESFTVTSKESHMSCAWDSGIRVASTANPWSIFEVFLWSISRILRSRTWSRLEVFNSRAPTEEACLPPESSLQQCGFKAGPEKSPPEATAYYNCKLVQTGKCCEVNSLTALCSLF